MDNQEPMVCELEELDDGVLALAKTSEGYWHWDGKQRHFKRYRRIGVTTRRTETEANDGDSNNRMVNPSGN